MVRNHELIGLHIEVSEAKNPSLIGLRGIIVDETKNTITIENAATTKKLLKNQVTLKVKLDDTFIKINGADLIGRSEERIKK